MGTVVARTSDPRLGRIKLAWWREQLEQLDTASPPAEPRLQAVAAELLPRGISGRDISEIEAGWATLLDERVDPQLVADRGRRLFQMIATLLGGAEANIGEAGALWALVTNGRHEEPAFIDLARASADHLSGVRFPMRLRALSLLGRLAADDLARGVPSRSDSPRRRVLLTLAHIWSGAVIARS